MKRDSTSFAVKTVAIRTPVLAVCAFALSACATDPDAMQSWGANGYLTPGPTSEPQPIGVFDTRAECEDAAAAWASRQVVGNPVYAECLPVDTR